MKGPRQYAKRKDQNHNEIVAALVSAGVAVADLSRLGNGAPDILCYVADWNEWLPIEIKSESGTLTDEEIEWWKRMDIAPILARNPAEALSRCGLSALPITSSAPTKSAIGRSVQSGTPVSGGRSRSCDE